METKTETRDELEALLGNYSLLDALRNRRSRRFGVGMAMETGPLAYSSDQPTLRLSEDEEAGHRAVERRAAGTH